MINTISKVMNRHLEQLKKEILAYPADTDLWLKQGDIPNSAGNLALHLCGNLQHYLGAVLANSGYIRQRDEEFSRQNVPLDDLIVEVDKTIEVVNTTLAKLSEEQVKDNYPLEVFGSPMTIEYFLVHLTSHLAYHVGQLNYHRRILAAENKS